MANSSPTMTFIFVLLMSITIKWCACCEDSERKALLNFKQHGLTLFGTNVTSSWEGQDCCKWDRVSCDPTTGDVLKLQFSGRCFENEGSLPNFIDGENLESSLKHLKKLKHLEHLDLSCNDFSESQMPKALGSMHQLRYLSLSNTYFSSGIPDELSNLTHLQFLDLSYAGSLNFNHLDWISSLRELQYLDMSGSNLSQAHDWMKSLIGPLPFLRELRLPSCELPPHNKAILNTSLVSLPLQHLDLSGGSLKISLLSFIQNLTSLEYLDLSYNNLGPSVPLWLGKLQRLVHLDLSHNEFSSIDARSIGGLVHNLCSLRFLGLSFNKLQGNLLEPLENSSTICTHYDLEVLDLSPNYNKTSGAIPTWLGEKFQSLRHLNLRAIQLYGEIPTSFWSLYAMEELDLSLNNFMGQIPDTLGNFSKLKSLDMFSNPLLNGTILSKSHFANLSNLSHLDLSSETFLTLKLPIDWVPPFQLEYLSVGSCKINGIFPQWLQTQKHLKKLNLSNVGISGEIPKWFHAMQELEDVDLSYNHISGSPIFPINFRIISLSNNALSSPLFSMDNSLYINITYPNANSVDLSSNSISGLLPKYLDRQMPMLQSLTLGNNQIYGPIPTSMCKLELLILLALQKNRLSGTIPYCFKQLKFVILSSNKLRGTIPCFGLQTILVHLNDNKLSGQLPPCFENNTGLTILDVGGNELSGKMPAWLTNDKVPNLAILRLRGNKLSGSVPHRLCSLPFLQILDLADNHLSGTIFYCLSNLMTMSSPQWHYGFEISWEVVDGVNEVIQGIERAYTTTLMYLTNIDLSCNELVGNIPDGITHLSNLFSLNLSNNHLTGVIPQKIGSMEQLIALDVSNNSLWGTIPTSMANLYRLGDLNLSYNNFSGQIPTGNQLQTLTDPSIYVGNPFLCGDFLPKKCKTINDAPNGSENKGVEEDEDKDNKHETMWFYLVVMSGFATGFWGFIGSLLLKRSWRQSLFERVEAAYDWLYVVIVVRMAKLKTRWEGSSN